jgi:RimJ/RimL family protein N-acetyltransferase
MDECPTNHPSLPTLFDPDIPDRPVLWAVLKGRHAGRAWVDDAQAPSQCVLRTDANLTFSSRSVSIAFLDRAIAQARRVGPVWLIWSSDMHPQLHRSKPARVTERLAFSEYDANSPELTDLRQRVPDGYQIRRIDRALLQRCEWRSDMEFFCGSLENFLAHNLGLCMMHGDEIIVEAYASSLGLTHSEIGAVTRKAYRGRGYAPVTCAHLIAALERRGYHAYWSCDSDNVASIRVAQKLGFRHQEPYDVLEYNPDNG